MGGLYSKVGAETVWFYIILSVKGSFHFCEWMIVHGEPLRAGCTDDECCVGDEGFSRGKSGPAGMSSKTYCTTSRTATNDLMRPCVESSARMTQCTRASCDGTSSHSQVPLKPGAIGGDDPPRQSQMHRRSFPGMIWHSRPVLMWRTSMKHESKMRTYGG
jgi:hypothetical protein